MIDLDNFKHVNDTYGHKIGDEVLTGLADFLQVTLHSEEVRYQAGRWGGEEFMIVLPGMHLKEAAEIAEKLRVFSFHFPLSSFLSVLIPISTPSSERRMLVAEVRGSNFTA